MLNSIIRNYNWIQLQKRPVTNNYRQHCKVGIFAFTQRFANVTPCSRFTTYRSSFSSGPIFCSLNNKTKGLAVEKKNDKNEKNKKKRTVGLKRSP